MAAAYAANADHEKERDDSMTKKERAYIEKKAEQYRKWAKEEAEAAKRTSDNEEKEERYLQSRINDAAGEALEHILTEIE